MCPNCNAPIRGDAEYCTSCGTRVRPSLASGGAPVTQPAPPPLTQPAPPPRQPTGPYPGTPTPPPHPTGPYPGTPAPPPQPTGRYPGAPAPGWHAQPKAAAAPPFRFDLKRLTTPDLIIGGASVIALLSLFLPWFGILGYSTSGMSLHGYLVISLLAALTLLGYLLLRAGWDKPPFRLPIAHAPLLLIGTAVQLLFVLIAFLQSDGLGHEFGSYLGLLAALVACGVIAVPVIRSVLDARGGTG